MKIPLEIGQYINFIDISASLIFIFSGHIYEQIRGKIPSSRKQKLRQIF